MFKLIVFNHTKGEDRPEVVIAEHLELSEARRIAKLFCGKGFTMNRRPEMHTFDHIAVKVVRE